MPSTFVNPQTVGCYGTSAPRPKAAPTTPSAARLRLSAVALLLAAAFPILFITVKVVAASRNIVFWDEFGTALDLVLRLNEGAGWNEILHRLFDINNEHRMFTSRLLFASSYWTTGTINFHFIGAVGNLFLVGACGLLIWQAQTAVRRVRLAVLLSFIVFQLENFENFLWSGASIDHFQIVLLAVATITAVVTGSRPALWVGALCAFLATFTLAHGCITWVVGAAILWHQRRWHHLVLWCPAAVAVLALFAHGFQINPGHHVADFSLGGLAHIGRYWLTLLGGPLTFGNQGAAPEFGILLLAIFAYLGVQGAARREPVMFFTIVFAFLALGLVALGRAEVTDGQILSRYMILGTVAWALTAFLLLEQLATPHRPFLALACCLPALYLFNSAANQKFAALAEGYTEARDRAVLRFRQYADEDGHGPVRLHPIDGYAKKLLDRARDEGVYTLPALCEPRSFPNAVPTRQMVAYVDEKTISAKTVYLGGWAMLPGTLSERGQIHVILRSKKTRLIYTTVTVQRPDVAQAYHEPLWRLSGFRFVIDRSELPVEDLQVGLLISEGGEAHYQMTDQYVRLTRPEQEPWISNDSD